ncbi:hypothetical protein [Bradyrhizobium sp. RT10b]|uniref:hypothetical protein n=1 Tax=Bradyrhizobium sp. RT10b TaxID=3156331 RepID=UPI0033955141
MSEPFFHLTLNRRTGSFGETAAAEAHEVAALLHRAAQVIASGVPIDKPEQRELKCSGGHVVGYFEFSEDAIKGPGPGFDRTHFRTPSALELANPPRRALSQQE